MHIMRESVPMTCIDGRCNRAGIQVLDSREKCFECGGDLFPYEDFEFEDDDAGEDDDELIVDGDGGFSEAFIRKQRIKALMDGEEDIQADLFEGIGEYYKERPRSYPGISTHNATADTFQCPSDLSGCPIASKARVNIPVEMFNQWVYLAKKLDTEWIAYLTGEETGDNEYTIKGMYFPRQKANGVHCEAEDGEIREGTIAAVHSHVGMKAFFSAEDERHFNHPIEMVVNRAGDILGNGRTRLECGRWHRGPASLYFTGSDDIIEKEKDLREKIQPDRGFFKIVK